MSLKNYLLKDPFAAWSLGRIAGWRSADRLIRGGVLLPIPYFGTTYFRELMRREALYLRQRHKAYLSQ